MVSYAREGEELLGARERVDEGVGVGFVVVDVERGAGRGGHAEHLHERLGAVVARPHADGLLVDDLRDVVGVDAVEQERDRAAAHARGRGGRRS